MSEFTYPYDPTGEAATNLVKNELHTLTEVNSAPYRVLIPTFAPFYLANFALVHVSPVGVETPLVEGTDFYFSLPYMAASRSIGKMLYGGVAVISTLPQGTIKISYQTLGGKWCADRDHLYEMLLARVYNPRVVWWDQITNVQDLFPPTQHDQSVGDIAGHVSLLESLEALRQAILSKPNDVPAAMIGHIAGRGNPHETSKADLGLSDVENLPWATDQEVVERTPVDKVVTLRQILMLIDP